MNLARGHRWAVCAGTAGVVLHGPCAHAPQTFVHHGDRAVMTSQDQNSVDQDREEASRDDRDRDGTEATIQAVIQLAEQLAGDDVRDGYTHIGAATSGAFRFKWTARQ